MNFPIPSPGLKTNLRGFTLLEMLLALACLAIMLVMMAVSAKPDGAAELKIAAQQLSGLVDQARTKAVTCRKNVVLALIEPGALASDNESPGAALFELRGNPPPPGEALEVKQISRWIWWEQGVEFSDEAADGALGVLAQPKRVLRLDRKSLEIRAAVVIFTFSGGISAPGDSGKVSLALVRSRRGKARHETGGAAEQLVIGRSIARVERSGR